MMSHRLGIHTCYPSSPVRIVLWLGLVGASFARDIYVNPELGADRFDGLTAMVSSSDTGPVQTLKRAIALAGPGDTVHLAPTKKPYRDGFVLYDRAGIPGRPIVIDGHGVTLTGAEPLDPREWTDQGGGLYANETLHSTLHANSSLIQRFFLIFDGVVQRMNRTSKGFKADFKEPTALLPGEWTFEPKTKAFYVRISPQMPLAAANIEIPIRMAGVAISGTRTEHLIIKNLTVKHVWNDGYNIHGRSRDLSFENIRAFECGDDGLSAHDDCSLHVTGFSASRNSTGITNVGSSVCYLSNVRLGGNFAYEFFADDNAQFFVRDAIIGADAARPFVITGRPERVCRVELENVIIFNPSRSPRIVEVGTGGLLRATRTSTIGLSWHVTGRASVSASILAGGPEVELKCAGPSAWESTANIYDLGAVQIGERRSNAQDFATQHSPEEEASSSAVELTERQRRQLFTGAREQFSSVGAHLQTASEFPERMRR